MIFKKKEEAKAIEKPTEELKPAQIRDKEIQMLRDHLNGVYKDYSLTTLTKGEMYKIPQGYFSGLSGKVVESDKNKVKLELKSLGMTITLKHQAA